MRTTTIRYLNSSFRHYFLCPYLPLSAGKDTLSHSLLKFKRRIQPDLDTWIGHALEGLKRIPFPRDTVILRALQHDETAARKEFPGALDILGQTMAGRFHCRYLPAFLRKSRPTQACKYLTRDQRLTELQDIYYIDPSVLPPRPEAALTPFLLIDDIFTTGATIQMLIQTLRLNFPACPIRVFTLTRADYEAIPQSDTFHVKSNR